MRNILINLLLINWKDKFLFSLNDILIKIIV